MKELFNYCENKLHNTLHSEGKCLIELENNETIEDVKIKYCGKKEWYEVSYSNLTPLKEYKALNAYEYEKERITKEQKIYSGNLVLMNTYQAYLD